MQTFAQSYVFQRYFRFKSISLYSYMKCLFCNSNEWILVSNIVEEDVILTCSCNLDISTVPHFQRLPRSEGVIDSLCLITYLVLRIGYGEMNGNKAATYMMQGSNYNDARKPFLRLHDIYQSINKPNILRHKIQVNTMTCSDNSFPIYVLCLVSAPLL